MKFFQELDRAKQNPAVNLGLLEIMHACLSLGFEGVYRASSSGGAGALQGVRRDLYETIRRVQPKTIEDLSPHWRGQTIGSSASRLQRAGLVDRRGRRRRSCSASISSCATC